MKYPETKKEETQDNIFGKSIEDPYRWLEDFTSEEATDWVKEQNELTDSFTSNEYQKNIKKELESIWITQDISIPFRRGNKTFYYFDDGRKQQAVFMVKACNDCEPKVLLDPNKFSTDGTISLSDISVSPNGDYLAYSVSDGGSDWRIWKVLNIKTKQETDDLIEWSKFSYAVWESDSSGFYYQKYDQPEESLSDINKSPQLFFHKLGRKQIQQQFLIGFRVKFLIFFLCVLRFFVFPFLVVRRGFVLVVFLLLLRGFRTGHVSVSVCFLVLCHLIIWLSL